MIPISEIEKVIAILNEQYYRVGDSNKHFPLAKELNIGQQVGLDFAIFRLKELLPK